MAADSKELQSQLAIQQSINKVLQDRQKVLEKQQKYLSSQVDTAVQLCKALECKGLDDVQQKMKEVRDGLAGAASEAICFSRRALSVPSRLSRLYSNRLRPARINFWVRFWSNWAFVRKTR